MNALVAGIGGLTLGGILGYYLASKTPVGNLGVAELAGTDTGTKIVPLSPAQQSGLYPDFNKPLYIAGLPYYQAHQKPYADLVRALIKRAKQQGFNVTLVIPYGMPVPNVLGV